MPDAVKGPVNRAFVPSYLVVHVELFLVIKYNIFFVNIGQVSWQPSRYLASHLGRLSLLPSVGR